MIEVIKQFLFMGGYALYVWLAYGMLLVILSLNFILAFFQQRRLHRTVILQQPTLEKSYES